MHALVVYPDFALKDKKAARAQAAKLAEAVGLAAAIEVDVADAQIVRVSNPKPATLFGAGQVERLSSLIAEKQIALVVVDSTLTPVQQRNLEKAWNSKVIDRTALILEIFGKRARTREGQLQVELAALEYQKSRLVRSWTHLERQRGGFGFLGGPGESQIETDRRLIRDRIAQLKRQLEHVKRTRNLHRKQRREVPFPLVALVGYTNAGKSTLFNRLTRSEVFAENLLFATLDPTIRQARLPSGIQILFSDTVGFISDLPTELVAAFRATLEEVLEADLLLHVRDITHADTQAQKEDVEAILQRLFAEVPAEDRPPMLEVWNKMDLLGADAAIPGQTQGKALAVSAVTGEGIEMLRAAIERALTADWPAPEWVTLPPEDGRTLAWLYANGQVLARQSEADGTLRLQVRLSPTADRRLHPAATPF